jgi:hypothetical protein
VVAPGADPNQIALRFDGVQSLHVDAQGNLVLHTTGGDVVEQAPVVYEQGPGIRTPVVGGYVVGSDGEVHFKVGAFDRSQPLVIDPVLVYSTYLGGSNTDIAYGVALDADRNVYVTGQTFRPLILYSRPTKVPTTSLSPR